MIKTIQWKWVALLAGVMLCLASGAHPSDTGTRVGRFLKDQSVVDVGCSFYSSPKTGKATVFVDMDDANLWINLLGRDTRFRLVASKGKKLTDPTAVFKVGDVYTRTYRSGNERIEMKNRVTGVCAPNDEHCESMRVLGEFKITSKGNLETIQLKGGCGA